VDSYKLLFYKNELKSFLGKGYLNFLRLFAILFLTIFALAFANAGYNYLKVKMSNPFTNWVTIDLAVKYISDAKKSSLIKYFDTPKNLAQFRLKENDKPSGFDINNSAFKAADGKSYSFKGRTIDSDDDLLKVIVATDNIVNSFIDLADPPIIDSKNLYNIIVTEKLIEELGYENSTKKLRIRFYHRDKNDVTSYDANIWVDIIAIVESLPNETEFVLTPNLYNALNNDSEYINDFIDSDSDRGNLITVISEVKSESQFDKLISTYLDTLRYDVELLSEFPISESEVPNIFNVYLKDDQYNNLEFADLFRKINAENSDLFKFHYFNLNKTSRLESINRPYYYAFNFDELSKIRAFRDSLDTKFDARVDMNQVESKENFSFVSAITLALSAILFLLGLCVVIVYLMNLLKSHIEKISRNLGTYKAFGLNNSILINIYLLEIFTLLLGGIILSYLSIWLLNKLNIINYILSFLVEGIDISQFDLVLNNFWIHFAIFTINVITLIFAYFSLKKLLDKTPGDLIYNRN